MSDRGTLNNLPTHEEFEELIPLFALGVLDTEEAAAVSAHLPVCPACSAQLHHFEAVTGLLGAALDPVAPSAGQREALLDRASALPQDGDRPTPISVSAPTEQPAPVSSSPAPVVPLAERRPVPSSASSSVKFWALAAAAALVIGLGGLGYWINDLIDQRDDARSTANTLAAFVAPDSTVMPMSQMPASQYGESWGSGRMMKDDHGRMIVVVEGCPPTTDDRTYKVWVGEGGDRMLLGDMVISEDGSGWMPVSMPAEMPTPEILGVSVVEGSGSPVDLFIGEMPA